MAVMQGSISEENGSGGPVIAKIADFSVAGGAAGIAGRYFPAIRPPSSP